MRVILQVLLAIVLSQFADSQQLWRLVPIVTKLEMEVNNKYCNVSCSIDRTLPIENQTVVFEIDVVRLIREVKVSLSYFIVTKGSAGKNPLVTRNIDACAFLRRPKVDRFATIVYNMMTQNSSLPTRCPIKPGHYYLRNIRPAAVKLPGFLPETEFLLQIMYLTGTMLEPAANSLIYGKLVRRFDWLDVKQNAST
ncbi:AGAP011020-PA-like protein [Anopheles sinensis]|uniref:AGAP011020-PA-like protein n=1 Tax=Anopheles sinensis TaxID=74873 RepID=A0A084W983_ANOSI|nr:AGAP011020-PA-like protein [Anopheles sinensis]